MTNELATKREAEVTNHYLRVAAETETFGPFLKFNSGAFLVGDNEIPEGREYIAHMDGAYIGWVKFSLNKVVARRMGKIADGFIPAEREALGDNDRTRWDIDGKGDPKDPWVLQRMVPFEDVKTREVVWFATSTAGGIGAVGELCGDYGRNRHLGMPVIKLAVSGYKNKKYGSWVDTPNFPIVRWKAFGAGDEAGADEEDHTEETIKSLEELKVVEPAARGKHRNHDMDDDIPF
jgi:hypothetical protein